MAGSITPAPSEIVLLSGHDLRRLLNPKVVIEALREAYAALADNRGDQGRSVGFMIEGGSIHVKRLQGGRGRIGCREAYSGTRQDRRYR